MENQKTTPPSDEIDLSQLFAKIGSFFLNIGFGVIRFLALLRNVPLKNKALFISLILICTAIGFTYSTFSRKKFYESSMILNSDYLSQRMIDDAIDKFNLLAREEGPAGLALVLGISDSLAKDIMEFEAKPFISEEDLIVSEVLKQQLKAAAQNVSSEKENKMVGVDQLIQQFGGENTHSFQFIVRAYNHSSMRLIQNALVNYFKDNDYIKKRIDINRTLLKARREKLVIESRKLDSLKKVIYANYRSMSEQTKQGSNNVILGERAITSPIEVYSQDMALYDQISNIDRSLYLQADFEVVSGLTEFNKPANFSISKVIVIGALIGFGLGYVIVALLAFNHYLSKVE